MKKTLILTCFMLAFLSYGQVIKPPKLVVGIVVDQMRNDFIYRFWDKYEKGGFKKLVNEGFFCRNTHFNYVPTYTGPGHACIYTGTTPSVNGIISNNWFDKSTGNSVYCTGDESVLPVGSQSPAGKMSPKYLLSTTITDELRLSNNFKSKVIGIALKDRSAIFPAGHTANAAYWFDGSTGKWISSSHYLKELPKWLQDFNNRNLPDKYLSKKWNTLLPLEDYTESMADDNSYEAPFTGEEKPVFPHNLPELMALNLGYNLLKSTPFGNTLTTELAKAAIKNEELGKDEYPDLLAISYSATDYVGHRFGPHSIETEDTYLRLDRELANLLVFLDKEIGIENYVIFLTSDHGAVSVPAYLKDKKIPAGYFQSGAAKSAAENYLKEKYEVDSLVLNFSNYQFFLNYELIRKRGIKTKDIQKDIVQLLLRMDGVSNALTSSEILTGDFKDGMLPLVQKGYSQKLSGDVVVMLQPGWIEWQGAGTTHGSAYSYDTHVPLIWYGAGMEKGHTTEYVSITDIAPTLSMILNIPFPNGCTGQPIKFNK